MLSDQCEECLVGRCRPANLPYLRKFGPHMIVLPNAPASKCDMCGNVAYQTDFLMTMQVMLEEIAKEQRMGGLQKTPVPSRRPGWTPAGRGG
jgi:hypothetical protein